MKITSFILITPVLIAIHLFKEDYALAWETLHRPMSATHHNIFYNWTCSAQLGNECILRLYHAASEFHMCMPFWDYTYNLEIAYGSSCTISTYSNEKWLQLACSWDVLRTMSPVGWTTDIFEKFAWIRRCANWTQSEYEENGKQYSLGLVTCSSHFECLDWLYACSVAQSWEWYQLYSGFWNCYVISRMLASIVQHITCTFRNS